MGQTAEAGYRPSNHNLPYQLTTFVGRSVELAELKRLLRERRLVTLTGAGGSGKTRLAIETAAEVASCLLPRHPTATAIRWCPRPAA